MTTEVVAGDEEELLETEEDEEDDEVDDMDLRELAFLGPLLKEE